MKGSRTSLSAPTEIPRTPSRAMACLVKALHDGESMHRFPSPGEIALAHRKNAKSAVLWKMECEKTGAACARPLSNSAATHTAIRAAAMRTASCSEA